jgi:hypothetical protein
MGQKAKAHQELTLIPMLPHETLNVGVDVGKFRHVAGFLRTAFYMSAFMRLVLLKLASRMKKLNHASLKL